MRPGTLPPLRPWVPAPPERPERRTGLLRRPALDLALIFSLIFGVDLAFGVWMDARGFLWGDALSRATGALIALHGADPQLPAIGFVWMPLPALLELAPVSFYPIFPDVVASGFASTFVSALAGGATAAVLLGTARALGVSGWYGWAYALVVSLNPMLFLYFTNGMSEGIGGLFLTGAVCSVVLFWHTGRRRYVAVSSLALALGFAALYQAVQFGGALFAALVLGVLYSSETKESAPQGRWRAVEALGLLFLVPSFIVGAVWVATNWAIVGDPLYFSHSQYSNAGVVAGFEALVGERFSKNVEGDLLGSMLYTVARSAPFLIPGVLLLLVRTLDGRLRRVNSLSLVLLMGSVPFGLVMPMLYQGTSFGKLRYFMYPFFVAAGWGLYEVVRSQRRKRTAALLMLGWLLAAPVTLWTMSIPQLGQDEHQEVRALLTGQNATQTGYTRAAQTLPLDAPVSRYLDGMGEDSRIVLDGASGWEISAQVSPDTLKRIVTSSDRRFEKAVRKPGAYDTIHFLVPDPDEAPYDYPNRRLPALYAGDDPRFRRVETFPGTPGDWRLYEVLEPSNEEKSK